MSDCIFCMLAHGDIPTDMVYEDDQIAVFKDAAPVAPVHVLMVPKKHIASLDALEEEDQALVGYMLCKVKEIAQMVGLDNGYRLTINCGEDGMQTVQHLHMHIMGQRKMSWPPG